MGELGERHQADFAFATLSVSVVPRVDEANDADPDQHVVATIITRVPVLAGVGALADNEVTDSDLLDGVAALRRLLGREPPAIIRGRLRSFPRELGVIVDIGNVVVLVRGVPAAEP